MPDRIETANSGQEMLDTRIISARNIKITNEPSWTRGARIALARATTDGGINRRDYETCVAADKGIGRAALMTWVFSPLRKAGLVRTIRGQLKSF